MSFFRGGVTRRRFAIETSCTATFSISFSTGGNGGSQVRVGVVVVQSRSPGSHGSSGTGAIWQSAPRNARGSGASSFLSRELTQAWKLARGPGGNRLHLTRGAESMIADENAA